MARDILIRLNKLSATGKVPADATVRFTPAVLRADADGFIIPEAFDVDTVDGQATVQDVPNTDLNWAYSVQILNGRNGTWSWFVHVPEGTTAINFEDLPRIDPATMTPVNDPDPAWVDAVTAVFSDTLTTELDTQVPTRMVAETEDTASPFRTALNAASVQAISEGGAARPVLDTAIKKAAPKATAHTIVDIPVYDGNPSVGHPDVLHVPGGWNGYEYWMGYTPFPTSNRENPCIAASHDGIKWENPAGLVNPIASLADAVASGYDYWADTDLVLSADKTTMHLIFKGTKGGVTNEYVMSTSTNGVNWTPYQVVIPNAQKAGISPSLILEDDGSFTMFECGEGTINRRRSTDGGKTWTGRTPAAFIPGFEPGYGLWHLDVCKTDDGVYHALVNASGDTGEYEFRLYYWTSTDGLNWTGSNKPAVPTTGTRLDKGGHYRSTIQPAASGLPGRFDVWVNFIDDTRWGYDSAVWRIALIRDFDFSDGETWNFPAANQAMMVTESDQRIITAAQLVGTQGSPPRGQVPAGFGGFPAIGLPDTAKMGVAAVFPPLPDSWSHFVIEALVVHDTEAGGAFAIESRVNHRMPTAALNTGSFRSPGFLQAGARLAQSWVRVDSEAGYMPNPVIQGAFTGIEIQRNFGWSTDTLAGPIWVLAFRLRRVRAT